jgi:hypothetical protein
MEPLEFRIKCQGHLHTIKLYRKENRDGTIRHGSLVLYNHIGTEKEDALYRALTNRELECFALKDQYLRGICDGEFIGKYLLKRNSYFYKISKNIYDVAAVRRLKKWVDPLRADLDIRIRMRVENIIRNCLDDIYIHRCTTHYTRIAFFGNVTRSATASLTLSGGFGNYSSSLEIIVNALRWWKVWCAGIAIPLVRRRRAFVLEILHEDHESSKVTYYVKAFIPERTVAIRNATGIVSFDRDGIPRLRVE